MELGWIGKATAEGSNLSAHRVLKRWLFWNKILCVVNNRFMECYMR